jgi:hypothetical protein
MHDFLCRATTPSGLSPDRGQRGRRANWGVGFAVDPPSRTRSCTATTLRCAHCANHIVSDNFLAPPGKVDQHTQPLGAPLLSTGQRRSSRKAFQHRQPVKRPLSRPVARPIYWSPPHERLKAVEIRARAGRSLFLNQLSRSLRFGSILSPLRFPQTHPPGNLPHTTCRTWPGGLLFAVLWHSTPSRLGNGSLKRVLTGAL